MSNRIIITAVTLPIPYKFLGYSLKSLFSEKTDWSTKFGVAFIDLSVAALYYKYCALSIRDFIYDAEPVIEKKIEQLSEYMGNLVEPIYQAVEYNIFVVSVLVEDIFTALVKIVRPVYRYTFSFLHFLFSIGWDIGYFIASSVLPIPYYFIKKVIPANLLNNIVYLTVPIITLTKDVCIVLWQNFPNELLYDLFVPVFILVGDGIQWIGCKVIDIVLFYSLEGIYLIRNSLITLIEKLTLENLELFFIPHFMMIEDFKVWWLEPSVVTIQEICHYIFDPAFILIEDIIKVGETFLLYSSDKIALLVSALIKLPVSEIVFTVLEVSWEWLDEFLYLKKIFVPPYIVTLDTISWVWGSLPSIDVNYIFEPAFNLLADFTSWIWDQLPQISILNVFEKVYNLIPNIVIDWSINTYDFGTQLVKENYESAIFLTSKAILISGVNYNIDGKISASQSIILALVLPKIAEEFLLIVKSKIETILYGNVDDVNEQDPNKVKSLGKKQVLTIDRNKQESEDIINNAVLQDQGIIFQEEVYPIVDSSNKNNHYEANINNTPDSLYNEVKGCEERIKIITEESAGELIC
jgi:hypothetical protein